MIDLQTAIKNSWLLFPQVQSDMILNGLMGDRRELYESALLRTVSAYYSIPVLGPPWTDGDVERNPNSLAFLRYVGRKCVPNSDGHVSCCRESHIYVYLMDRLFPSDRKSHGGLFAFQFVDGNPMYEKIIMDRDGTYGQVFVPPSFSLDIEFNPTPLGTIFLSRGVREEEFWLPGVEVPYEPWHYPEDCYSPQYVGSTSISIDDPVFVQKYGAEIPKPVFSYETDPVFEESL